MNLVQIQERLKDMPLQAVMQYANGMNPEVPPYLALGELNRRKKMEQAMQPAEMPQGTIKEQLEQEVGLAALQKQLMNQLQTQGLRQQQSAMSQGQQIARMPGPAPQGVPQPEVPEEVEMAGGGVATLMVPDDQFEFGSGGIIAFKEGGDKGRRIPTSELDIDPLGTSEAGTEAYLAKLAKEAEEKKKQEDAARLEFLERAGVPVDMVKAAQEGRVLTTNPITPDRGFPDNRGSAQRFPPGPPHAPSAAPAPAPARQHVAQAAAPQGIAAVAPQQVAYPQAGPMQQALAAMAMGPQTPYPSYDEERRKAEERNPYLKKPLGEKLEQYLATLERRDREDQERFQEMEKERTRAGLWRALIAGGEASRGQRGIGASLAGFGRAAGEELEAGRGREERQRALMREREMNRVKMAQEIENARIAAAQGQEKERMEHLQKAAQFNQRDKELAFQISIAQANTEAAIQGRQYESASAMDRERFRIEAEDRRAALDRQARQAIANMPSPEQRIIDSYIASRKKVNPNEPFHESFEAYKRSAQGGIPAERQQLAELKALQSSLKSQLETTFKTEDRKKVQEQLNQVNEAIGRMAGIGAAQNVPSDIKDILKRYSR